MYQIIYVSTSNVTSYSGIEETFPDELQLNSSVWQGYWNWTNNCMPNDYIVSKRLVGYTSKIQNFLIVISFIIIFFLYALISVVALNQRKSKINRANHYKGILHRSKLHTAKNNSNEGNFENETNINVKNYDSMPGMPNEKLNLVIQNQEQKSLHENEKICKETEFNNENQNDTTNQHSNEQFKVFSSLSVYSKAFIANLRTSAILFIVTIIMILVYTPAILISFQFIDYNTFLWSLIYVNNASNPIIYSFFNPKFRDALRSLF